MAFALTLIAPAPVASAASTDSGSIIRLSETYQTFLFSNPEYSFEASGAEILLDGASASFSQLQPGDTATLTLNSSNALVRVDALSQPVQQLSGTLSGVDTRHGHVTVSLADGLSRVLWNAPGTTSITLNGASISFNQLKSGEKVQISYRTLTALSISATS